MTQITSTLTADRVVASKSGDDLHFLHVDVEYNGSTFYVSFTVPMAAKKKPEWSWLYSVVRDNGAEIDMGHTDSATEKEAKRLVRAAAANDQLYMKPEDRMSNCDKCGKSETECVQVTCTTMWCLACVAGNPAVNRHLRSLGWTPLVVVTEGLEGKAYRSYTDLDEKNLKTGRVEGLVVQRGMA